ncbi:MAG: AzlD domain-containing protein [Microthrixaceae bacterium]
MSWLQILVLAAIAYAFKAVGLVVLGGRELTGPALRAVSLLPPALLAGLVAVQTFTDGRSLELDARVVGLAFAGIGVWRRWPFVVIVVGAAAVTAAVRAIA